MNLCFVGDIMPGGVLPYQDKYVDQDVLDYMRAFDLRVGTLECGVGTNIPFDATKMANTMGIVYARDVDILRLKELRVDVVSMANNHAFDLGVEGMENAFRQLDNLGIKYCGAGHNIEEAKKPAIVEIGGKTIAFIGCMIDVPSPVMFHKATKNDYGVYQVGIDVLQRDIKEAKQKYDYVIVLPHWGEEHCYSPKEYCKECGMKMIDAGADAVIGSHPHIINPVVRYKGKYIYFSLGNFLFPDKCMQVPRPMYYPSTKEEYLSLKRVWTYPYRIEEPVVAVWKPQNRIGMMVDLHIGKTINSTYRLTSLSTDNVLHHYDSKIVRIRMKMWSLLVKLPNYRIVRRLYVHRYNIIRRAMDKLPAFNIPVEL